MAWTISNPQPIIDNGFSIKIIFPTLAAGERNVLVHVMGAGNSMRSISARATKLAPICFSGLKTPLIGKS